MPSLPVEDLRRLDELVDDWAVWHCAKPNPGKPSGASLYRNAVDTGRQWQPLSDVVESIARTTARLTDAAIDDMAEAGGEEHRRVLESYAWLHFHRKAMQAAVVRSNRVTDEQVEAAKLALLPFLRRHGLW